MVRAVAAQFTPRYALSLDSVNNEESSMLVIRSFILLVGITAALGISSARAVTTIAGVTFENDAFADTVISSFGECGPTNQIPQAGFPEDALGSNVDTFASCTTPGSYIELGFIANPVVNRTGDDIGIFELGSVNEPQFVSLTVGGPAIEVSVFDTGEDTVDNFNINYGSFDLSELGVPLDASVQSIAIFSFCAPEAAAQGICTEGDQIVTAIAVVGSLSATPPVRGTLRGIDPAFSRVRCINMTTGQSLIAVGDSNWDCEAAGLVVNPGDIIRQNVLGVGIAE